MSPTRQRRVKIEVPLRGEGDGIGREAVEEVESVGVLHRSGDQGLLKARGDVVLELGSRRRVRRLSWSFSKPSSLPMQTSAAPTVS